MGKTLTADILLSRHHGAIGRLISNFQERPGKRDHWSPSHVAVCLGQDMIAEATFPRGGIRNWKRYLTPDHDLQIVRIPHWTPQHRSRIALVAGALARRDYDTLNIARHLVDNLFERLRLGRPLARLVKDKDGYGQNVCSELLEWAVNLGTSDLPRDTLRKLYTLDFRLPPQEIGEKLQSGRVGQARPYDVVSYCNTHKAEVLITAIRGVVTYQHKESDPRPLFFKETIDNTEDRT